MDSRTKGAWLLSQSRTLDGVSGAGAARLENIAFAGKVGRLYNLLRRNVAGELSPTVPKETVETACKLNGIDRATRAEGLRLLQVAGRVDVAANGSVSVIGSTVTAVLETTSKIFEETEPSSEEQATLELAEAVADKPMSRRKAIEKVADECKLSKPTMDGLVDLCREAALVDQEGEGDHVILFNSNTFRDATYAKKAYHVLENLKADERSRLTEVQEKIETQGALFEDEAKKILGKTLYERLVSVGLFDRLEVSNNTESVGYVSSPKDFQRYGKPFEEDPVDDAKALIASLTYGQTRSSYARGNIRLPVDLLNALIAGREIAKGGIKAIGEDYRELEKRQVVKVTQKRVGGYSMRLLKTDVGQLALTIVRGSRPAEAALLMDGSPAKSFKGPDQSRREVRRKNDANDRRFVADSLDRLRTGL